MICFREKANFGEWLVLIACFFSMLIVSLGLFNFFSEDVLIALINRI